MAEPNDVSDCLLVDIAHERHLLFTLLEIILIDTNNIDPDSAIDIRSALAATSSGFPPTVMEARLRASPQQYEIVSYFSSCNNDIFSSV